MAIPLRCQCTNICKLLALCRVLQYSWPMIVVYRDSLYPTPFTYFLKKLIKCMEKCLRKYVTGTGYNEPLYTTHELKTTFRC